MKVIFLQDILDRAQAGDIKEVKNGYARNYLIPNKLAARATPDQLQRLQGIKRIAEEKRLKESSNAEALARAIADSTVTLVARVANTGRLYGSVTVAQVVEELSRLLERPIERRMVIMEEPIRKPGEYQIQTRIGPGITASFTVVVQAQDQPADVAKEEAGEAVEDQAVLEESEEES